MYLREADNQVTWSANQLSLLGAMTRHKWLVLSIVLLFLAFGLSLETTASEEYEATAEVIVEDPRATTILAASTGEPRSNISSERYLADQVQILESTEVADVASELSDGQLSTEFILDRRDIEGSATSNLITVNFRGNSPESAKLGADSLVAAYLDVRRSQVQQSANIALERVDALQDALDEELAQIQQQISELAADDETRQELNSQIEQAFANFNQLRSLRNDAEPGSEARAQLTAQIDELIRDFEGWEVVLRIEQQDTTLAALLAEQDAAIAERANLTALRNSIAVEAELAAEGVTLVSLAQEPIAPTGFSTEVVVAGMVLLGLALAAAVSYYLSLRRRVITDRATPESILGTPLLAVVPEFDAEGSLTELPVSAASHSAAAEAFRFAAAAIDIRASAIAARSVVVSSVDEGAATSITVANTAIAAAYAGNRVAVVDANFGRQEISKLFELEFPVGMTEVVEGKVSVEHALQTAPAGNHRAISILQRGSLHVDASNFFHQESTKRMFRYLVESFDLILIASPSLTQVAYASTLARVADAAVLVVEHGTYIETLRQAADRLDLVGTPLLGYIYTKAPIRAASKYREPEPSEIESQPEDEPEEQAAVPSAAAQWFK